MDSNENSFYEKRLKFGNRKRSSNFIFVFKLIFIWTVLSQLNLNIIKVSGMLSISVKYKKWNGRILFCGNYYGCDYYYYTVPNKIKINNGAEENYVDTYSEGETYDLNEEENTVEFIWENDVENCGCLFSGCESITAIDFSNFDTSKVTYMEHMFTLCTNLTSLNLLNFNTAKVTNMRELFRECHSLTSLDLSNFDTSQVTNFLAFFDSCRSLAYLDLSSFDTSQCDNMRRMFYGCYLLPNLDLSNFDTSKVSNMWGMFYDCLSMTSLNLFNFNISDGDRIESFFYDCGNLTYINLGNATINHEQFVSELNNLSPNLKLFVNNETLYFLKSGGGDLQFSIDIWVDLPKVSTIITQHSAYINNFYSDEIIDSSILTNAYIKPSTIIGINIITSNPYLDEKSSSYISEQTNAYIKSTTITQNNIITSNPYLDKINESYNSDQAQINIKSSTIQENNIITSNPYLDKINDSNIVKNTEESSYINNLNTDSVKDTQIINYSDIKNKSELLNQIRVDMKNGKYITDINKGKYFIFLEDNIVIEISTTEREKQKEDEITNKTSINLGKCEYILKKEFNISNSSILYILKIDIKEYGYKIPKIEYEIYKLLTENNLTKLDLSPCKNEKIEHSIPVTINDDDIDKHNSSSKYYNDICSTTTSDYGTDISMPDRRDNFIDNNMTLCEENCKFIKYDYKREKAKCSCDIKLSIPFLIEDIRINKYELYKSFTDIKNILNIKLMKCYDIVLKISSLINNYGSFIIAFIIILYFIILIIFLAKYHFALKLEINKIVQKIKQSSPSTPSPNVKNKIDSKKLIKKNKKVKKNESCKNLKKSKLNSIELHLENNNNIINNINNINNLNRKNSKKIKRTKNQKSKTERNTKKLIKPKSTKEKIDNTKSQILKKKDVINPIDYSDYELNSLEYNEALRVDKRTYIQFYLSLLRTNHLFIFSFCPNKDYNSRIIKIFLFFFCFTVHFTVNALFFTDQTMHKILEDHGQFNFIYQFPKTLYSSVISGIFNAVIKKLGLSEKTVIELKKEKNCKNIINKENQVLKTLKIKFIFFFIFALILLGAFWYYITCFCGVYINTKIQLIKNTLISFASSLLYKFGICLLPGIFRIPSLKDKDKPYLYKFSNLLQIL